MVVRAEDAHRYTDKPIYIKALSFAAGSGSGLVDPDYDYTHFPECEAAADDAYVQAGITDPEHELALAEVHDCFTPTELVLMEDLGFAERGTVWKEVLAGTYALDGALPINPDGGLKSFGHPVGASGLRMFFECFLQLRGEAPPERRVERPQARARPQSRRLPRRDGLLRLGRRLRAGLSKRRCRATPARHRFSINAQPWRAKWHWWPAGAVVWDGRWQSTLRVRVWTSRSCDRDRRPRGNCDRSAPAPVRKS